jgi:hypothetical protein
MKAITADSAIEDDVTVPFATNAVEGQIIPVIATPALNYVLSTTPASQAAAEGTFNSLFTPQAFVMPNANVTVGGSYVTPATP